ncbi:hypothetical protein RJ53_09390 [Methanocalculus chunghsingensis]|uniref:CRISPR system single-strand-specific deoxyribonuclease Cas10/Csm1 (subtype III-A) n=1 Tax=Methanocalculus chunghsingensis TaxID=156457 RepID=A0A8J7W791_9EURY|nr:hypothetical protein [Methanocalculus chunghsingensis]
MEPDIQSLVYAALLHDIGKFYQRTGAKHAEEYEELTEKDYGYSGAHAKWSADLIRRVFHDKQLEDLVLHHHQPQASAYRNLAEILQEADHISAAIDRSRRDEKGDPKREHLWSIFSGISLGGTQQEVNGSDWHHRLLPFTLTREAFPTREQDPYHWKNDVPYSRLWAEFYRELSEAGRRPHPTTLLALLRKYTSSIPSAAYVDYPDIPLYDHAKTTAALATCIAAGEGKSPYLLVQGDLSGIQRFIFDVRTPEAARKGMAKRLRGRSFWISLLADAIVHEIIEAAGVSEANILWNTGGNFLLLLPGNSRVEEAIGRVRRSVNTGLLRETDGRLYCAFGSLACNRGEIEDFADCLERLHLITGRQKLRKFSECRISSTPTGEETDLEGFCPICEHRKSAGICPTCTMHEELGQRLAHASCFSRGSGLRFGFAEFGLLARYDLTEKPFAEPPEFTATINSTDFLRTGSPAMSFILLGNTVPLHKRRILTFGELAEVSQGDPKLGILKADVDNLGKIFALGIGERKKRSISRIYTLSSGFEHFFSGYLNTLCRTFGIYTHLCEECRNGAREISLHHDEREREDDEAVRTSWTAYEKETACPSCEHHFVPTLYITFSGGDDLLIIGPYDHIIRFAGLLQSEFEAYTCNNPWISLSAGVVAVPPRMPLAHAVAMAEDHLEEAKRQGKSRVAIFGECLPWKDRTLEKGYASLLSQGEALEAALTGKAVSRSFIHATHAIWEDAFADLDDIDDVLEKAAKREARRRYLPYLKYQIARNVPKNEKKRIEDLILPSFGWARFPITWTVMRTRRK